VSAGVLRVATLALLWGSSFVWIDLALQSFSPVQITWGRLLLGALVLTTIVRRRLVGILRNVRLLPHLAVAALLATAAPYLLFALSEQHIPSNLAGALNATTPIWTLLLALATRTQGRTDAVQVAGLVLGLAGVVLMLQPWTSASSTGAALLGSALALVAAASYGAGYVYVAAKITPTGLEATPLAAAQLLTASVLLVPAAPFGAFDAVSPSALPVVALLVLGIGGTGVAYLLLYRIITDDGPVAAAAVTYLLSVVAVVLGAVVLDDPLSWSMVLGVAAVLVGVALTRRGPSSGTAPGVPRRPATGPPRTAHRRPPASRP